MGEFSRSPDAHKKNRQVDLTYALRGSISFGRFLSESMDWEKWSAFTHNKHLEEAKNCSIPGSVAQKKAYFEAHYRRAASMKSAAVLEPENDMVGNDLLCNKLGNDEQKLNESSCLKAESRQKTERLLQSPCKIVDKHGLERMKGDNAGPTKLDEVHGKHSLQIKSSNNVQNIKGETIATEIDGQMQEKPPMKEVFTTSHSNEEQNKKETDYSLAKSAGIHQESRISSHSASKVQKCLTKENMPPQIRSEICLRTRDRRKPAPRPLHMPVSSNSVHSGQKPYPVNKTSPFHDKVDDPTKPVCNSARASERRYSHLTRQTRAFTSGSKYTTPQLEHTRNRTPSYGTSSARKKGDATKFCTLSTNCFRSPSARENRQLHARSASSSCKTNEQIPAKIPASPNFGRSNSKTRLTIGETGMVPNN